ILIAGTIEHHAGDPGGLGLLGEQLADGVGASDLALAFDADPLAAVGGAQQGHAAIVVDQLRVDVLERTVDHQTRPLGGAGDALANPQVSPLATLPFGLRRMDRPHTTSLPSCPPCGEPVHPDSGCPCPCTARAAGPGGFPPRPAPPVPCRCPRPSPASGFPPPA